MDILQIVRLWLADQGIDANIDNVQVAVGENGLFPLGQQVLQEREDVLGGIRRRVRYSFLLRHMAIPGEETAQKLLGLQQTATKNPPQLGENQLFRAERGKLQKNASTGLAIYELRLIAEREETQ